MIVSTVQEQRILTLLLHFVYIKIEGTDHGKWTYFLPSIKPEPFKQLESIWSFSSLYFIALDHSKMTRHREWGNSDICLKSKILLAEVTLKTS